MAGFNPTQPMKLFLSLLFSTLFLLQTSRVAAQSEPLPPRSINSLKVGLVGVWYSHERKLAPQATLNLEAGFDAAFNSSAFTDGASLDFGLVPTLRIEPRYYYNLQKRHEKKKRTRNYAANFLALSVMGNPNLVIPDPTPGVEPSLQITPKWGLRRSLTNNFVFEAAIGYGLYMAQFEFGGSPKLDLRFGYIF